MKKGFALIYIAIAVIALFLVLASLAPKIGKKLGLLSSNKQTQESRAAASDYDQDGFTDADETKIGTDPIAACPGTTSHNAWPPDLNNDRKVDHNDYSLLKGQISNRNYPKRLDLNVDGKLTTEDLSILSRHVGQTCEPKIPEASASIANYWLDSSCNGTWKTVKNLGYYPNNAIGKYVQDGTEMFLVLTTADYNDKGAVIAREIDPNGNYDSNWYKIFSNSQNSQILINENGKLQLYVYNYPAPGGARTIYRATDNGVHTWSNWTNMGTDRMGVTGPYTINFKGVTYRFYSQYTGSTPKALLQKCTPNPTPKPTATPTPIPNPSPFLGPYSLQTLPSNRLEVNSYPSGVSYGISAILSSNGSVVTNQSDFEYIWDMQTSSSILTLSPNSDSCTNGIQPPCPKDHALLGGKAPDGTRAIVSVRVIKKSTRTTVASGSFAIFIKAAN